MGPRTLFGGSKGIPFEAILMAAGARVSGDSRQPAKLLPVNFVFCAAF